MDPRAVARATCCEYRSHCLVSPLVYTTSSFFFQIFKYSPYGMGFTTTPKTPRPRQSMMCVHSKQLKQYSSKWRITLTNAKFLVNFHLLSILQNSLHGTPVILYCLSSPNPKIYASVLRSLERSGSRQCTRPWLHTSTRYQLVR